MEKKKGILRGDHPPIFTFEHWEIPSHMTEDEKRALIENYKSTIPKTSSLDSDVPIIYGTDGKND